MGSDHNLIIIGQGPSRLKYTQEIIDSGIEVWGCNEAFIEKPLIPNLTTIGFGDISSAILISNFYKHCVNAERSPIMRYVMLECYNRLNFYCKPNVYNIEKYRSVIPNIKPYSHGWAHTGDTGHTVIHQAIHDGYTNIKAYGFDMSDEHIYHDYKTHKELVKDRTGVDYFEGRLKGKFEGSRERLYDQLPEAKHIVTFIK